MSLNPHLCFDGQCEEAFKQQYLRARLVDELHLAFRLNMGSGENLFAGIDLTELGYRWTQHVPTEFAMYGVLKKDT